MQETFIKHVAYELRELLVERLQEEFPSDLEMACAICSFVLWKTLKKLGINCHFALGSYRHSDHCFVIINGYYLDITGTQFGLREVEFGPIHCSKYDYFKEDDEALKHIESNWPLDQIPTKCEAIQDLYD